MVADLSTAPKSLNQQVEIVRVFDAPRERVFAAWSDVQQLTAWHAPKGCTIRFRKFDFSVGGEFHSCIQSPDGQQCWRQGTYREIVAPARIVYALAIADELGASVDPANVGMDPDWPGETVVTLTLVEQAGKTKLTLQQTVLESLAKRTGAYPNWLQMLDRLAEKLTSA